MPKLPTCFKFYLIAYDNRIDEKFERKLNITIFAESEIDSIEKAKKIVERNFYEVTEVIEIIDIIE